MNRQQANRELLAILSSWIEAYPDLRFSQILGNMEFVKQDDVEHEECCDSRRWADEYLLEPQELLKRVKARIALNHKG